MSILLHTVMTEAAYFLVLNDQSHQDMNIREQQNKLAQAHARQQNDLMSKARQRFFSNQVAHQTQSHRPVPYMQQTSARKR